MIYNLTELIDLLGESGAGKIREEVLGRKPGDSYDLMADQDSWYGQIS